MKYYIKVTNEIRDISINDNKDNLNIVDFDTFNNIYLEYNYDYNQTIIKVNNIEQIIYIINSPFFKKIINICFNYELIEYKETHLLYFINKNCFIWDNELNIHDYKKILLNPLIYGIINAKYELISNHIISYQHEIENEVCHINIVKILNYFVENIDNLSIEEFNIFLYNKIYLVFNKFIIYNIYNLPSNFSDETIINIYTNLASKLGNIFRCHPVNDKQTTKTISRQIKYDPLASSLHFFSSNARQPLHNDYAYYEINNTPDWLAIFSLKSAEYGGSTSIITNNKIKTILEKYDSILLENINTDITYLYTDIENEDITHTKKLFDSKTNISNWNYFQIKEEFNNKEVMNIKEDFLFFLNKKITESKITTLSKILKRGDCIILNDHLAMHERSSFFGERHLQDVAFFSNNLPLKHTS
jgi:hypothetical protein